MTNNEGMFAEPSAGEYPGPTEERLAALSEQAQGSYRDFAMLTIVDAAKRDGATVTWLSPTAAWVTTDDRKVPLYIQFGPESVVGAALATSKWLSKRMLEDAGVRVPHGTIQSSPEDIIAWQKKLNAPIVVKPNEGAFGRGVTVKIQDPDSIRDAYHLAADETGKVLVEEFVAGDEYRVHAT